MNGVENLSSLRFLSRSPHVKDSLSPVTPVVSNQPGGMQTTKAEKTDSPNIGTSARGRMARVSASELTTKLRYGYGVKRAVYTLTKMVSRWFYRKPTAGERQNIFLPEQSQNPNHSYLSQQGNRVSPISSPEKVDFWSRSPARKAELLRG
ncbi:hypothetical protein MiSe_93540 [Microseira wollei NIES-4236]|uniref:Uncharacterized protein n=1 Tax=Microseira wollei NIES-4236 TaxID=2530354 RepID=A0AAV3XPP2_9CYAN|nr:hypothetical protein MiSe_93540 [Microseira wollei NIES-4236]